MVANAGHFDFLAPCDANLAAHEPQICASAAGFERAAFHQAFDRAVTDFFRRNLAPSQGPSRND